MTGPKGNSEFCFPETLNVSRGEAEGNTEIEVIISVLLYLPTQKIETNCEEIVCLTAAGSQICLNFMVHDLIMFESFVSPGSHREPSHLVRI